MLNICSGYYNRLNEGGGGSHENQCVVLEGGYVEVLKERVKASVVVGG